MIAKELADLTNTTVRTIRFYHQMGLLPIPGSRGSRRNYDLSHVARLTRIRWLTSAGIPLSRVAGILESAVSPGRDDIGRAPILVDLEATVVAIDEQLEQLRGQRARIQRLIDSAERSDVLSPMPPTVAQFYDEMEQRTGDDKVRRVIRSERDYMELAYYRGDMPPEAELLYRGFTEARRAESLALFDRVARTDPGSAPTDAELAQVATAVVERVIAHLGVDAARVVGSIDLRVAERAADLYLRLADGEDRRRARAVADAMLTAIGGPSR